MTTTMTKLLTADDLLHLSGEGVRGELIRGVLHETMPWGYAHGKIAMKLGFLLNAFIIPRKLGSLTGSDSGVWLERDPDTVREPDIAYFSAAKIPLDAMDSGYAEVPPDLVVEIVSPSDSRREVHDKTRMWLRYGVDLVWVVQPDTRTVDVYRAGPLGRDAQWARHTRRSSRASRLHLRRQRHLRHVAPTQVAPCHPPLPSFRLSPESSAAGRLGGPAP